MLKQYVRDKNYNPIGVMLAELKNGEVSWGYSLCHKKDTYNKAKGEMIAINRLNAETIAPVPKRMEEQWNKFAERCIKRLCKKPE